MQPGMATAPVVVVVAVVVVVVGKTAVADWQNWMMVVAVGKQTKMVAQGGM